MSITLGTDDGVWSVEAGSARRLGLAGKVVLHVAAGDGVVLAAIEHDGLYAVDAKGEQRIWEGNAHSCAVGPDGAYYAGTEPAMVFRSADAGESWRRCDAIDELPTRAEWTFPPPPHEPHVLSIDFLPGQPESVLAGVEVGGVLVSGDRGVHWTELNNGVYVDVHSVRPDPSEADRLLAITGAGFYASEDGGEHWEQRMHGVENGYTIGMQINPVRAGEVLLSSGDRPPGMNGSLYHSLDAGRTWKELGGDGLPKRSRRAAVPFFADGAPWAGTDEGKLLRASDAQGAWELVCDVGVAINAVAAEGSPSSVMH